MFIEAFSGKFAVFDAHCVQFIAKLLRLEQSSLKSEGFKQSKVHYLRQSFNMQQR